MALRDYLFKDIKIKQDGVFDLEACYKVLWRWFELNNYTFAEKEYQDIDEPGGKHTEISWYGEKKIDAYVKFVIEITFLILGINKVEIERGGMKVKTSKGSVEMRISSYLLKDDEDAWGKSSMQKTMRLLYDRYIIRNRLQRLENELNNEAGAFIDEIRSFLEMHKF